MSIHIISITRRPELIPAAAQWFHRKWQVPEEAYLDSMHEALSAAAGVPAWYLALNGHDEIVGGLGVIENDFHKRPDLRPNLCAIYVEESCRGQGLARRLLDTATDALAQQGIPAAYLITTHTRFYERCGWEFHCMVEEDNGQLVRMYRHTIQ